MTLTRTAPTSAALLPVLLALTACATAPPEDAPPLAPASYATYSRSDNNRIVPHGDAERTIYEIYSHKGIGSAVITLTDGDWPRHAVVRLHTRLLERFTIETPQVQGQPGTDTPPSAPMFAGLSVSSYGDHQVRQDPPREPTDPLFLPLKVVDFRTIPNASRLPIQDPDGYFEIQVPTPMLRAGAPHLKISWVDVYRN